jgi:hypothetical protein
MELASEEAYIPVMRIAFKEWAIVVDALGRGEQIVILRKGGISEGRAGFQVDYPKFWLFPTLFHQQRECVVEPAQARYDRIASQLAGPDHLVIQYFAEVVEWQRIESLDIAARLAGQHIWKNEVIAERFDWGKSKNIYALAVRVFRVTDAFELPMIPEYGGCKSWIELANDLETAGARPVLDEAAFQAKLKQFRLALSGAGTKFVTLLPDKL